MANKARRFALIASIAAVGGYLAGLLTAPKSGEQTRRDIAKKASETKAEAEKKLHQLHSEVDKLLEQAKQKAKKVKSGASTEFASAVTKAHLAKDKAAQVLNALKKRGSDDKDLDSAVKEAEKAIDNLKKYLAKDTK